MRTQNFTHTGASGFTLVEVIVAGSILAGCLYAILGMAFRENQSGQSTLSIGSAETKAQEMLYSLERELVHARGASPAAVLTQALGAGELSSITVDSTLGFPDKGLLLIDRGGGSVERVRYAGLDLLHEHFTGLARGEQCTAPHGHSQGADVLWGGLAEPILLQTNPAANLWDGRAKESTGPVYFRGDGSGFSYRVPTDPAGGTDYLDGGDVQWGASVDGTPSLTGWAALWFEPKTVYDEAASKHDLNGDGDVTDVFDVGQVRRRAWDTDAPNAAVRELGLGPSVVIQERCNWGGDLDHDGFDDPIFLWDSETRRLHVRLHVLGTTSANTPITRTVESTIFLRNEPEN